MVYTENNYITLNHHTNTPFCDESGNKSIEPKSGPEINQCVYLPPVNSLELSKLARVHITRFGIPVFCHKDSKRGQYGWISREEGNRPEDSYLASFKEYGYL